MKALTEIEMAKKLLLVTARMIIRRRHANAAERELNEVLPELEGAFDNAVQRGELPDESAIKALAEEVLAR